MKNLFNEWDLKPYTFEDKIKWVFENLIKELTPIVIRKDRIEIEIRPDHYFIVSVQIASCKNIEKFICPFPEIKVNFENELIIITGDNFLYKFKNENILWIYKEMKRALK